MSPRDRNDDDITSIDRHEGSKRTPGETGREPSSPDGSGFELDIFDTEIGGSLPAGGTRIRSSGSMGAARRDDDYEDTGVWRGNVATLPDDDENGGPLLGDRYRIVEGLGSGGDGEDLQGEPRQPGQGVRPQDHP